MLNIRYIDRLNWIVKIWQIQLFISLEKIIILYIYIYVYLNWNLTNVIQKIKLQREFWNFIEYMIAENKNLHCLRK